MTAAASHGIRGRDATGIRHGITILPELPWRESAPMWRAAEEMGFDHAWTYDHLVWGGLPDASWFAAVPTLAAAAGVTSTIGLGTFVSSPNYRHPYTFARDVLTLDDVSGGRFLCGLGTGGDLDARILGEERTLKQRVDRFHEFVPLLDRLLREDRVDHEGAWYSARGARTLPGPVRHRVPLLVAANGPRSIRLAATIGDGWITYGGRGDTLDEWFAHVGELATRFSDAADAAGRGPLDRLLSLDSSPRFSLESVELYAEMAGRAAALGFTDVVTHWPRAEGPYAGDVSVLEAVAAQVVGDEGERPCAG
ncbi:MAG TPA: LLM class flavin-dependent oxidoreductase [Ornithinibacter sp.]|nr:LLM class flavin-dependent oxidoreductase [Ornithinibacter sp.]